MSKVWLATSNDYFLAAQVDDGIFYENVSVSVRPSVRPSHLWVSPIRFTISK